MGETCVRNDASKFSLSDIDKMKAWVEHYSRLLNVEFEWPSDLPEATPVEGLPSPVRVALIWKALGKMKQGKAVGHSGGYCLGKVQETTSDTDFQACVTFNL